MSNAEANHSPDAVNAEASLQESSIQQRKENMFARYPRERSPKNIGHYTHEHDEILQGDEDLVLELAGQQIINEQNYKAASRDNSANVFIQSQ